jgi:ubiquinone/menaquinone biosynthesis C-methylase UbiE
MLISDEQTGNKLRVLEVGCGSGFISRTISRVYDTVGVDVGHHFSKPESAYLDFMLGDIYALPFRKASFDIIVCASVLEHMLDLDSALAELKQPLKAKGVLVAGYPVETRLFKLLLYVLDHKAFKFIDQSQTFWINPDGQVEDYWKAPDTHKQTYQTIRRALSKHFRLVQRAKLPSKLLPDSLAYYEIAECSN